MIDEGTWTMSLDFVSRKFIRKKSRSFHRAVMEGVFQKTFWIEARYLVVLILVC
jgi:hypothetical protein